MSSNNPQDRRRFPRFTPPSDAPIRIDINGENFIDIITATNISEGGVGITVEHGFEGCTLDNRVSFIIELPNEPKNILIQVEGKITHFSGNRFGVAFLDTPEFTRHKVKKYLTKRLEEESFLDWFKNKIGVM